MKILVVGSDSIHVSSFILSLSAKHKNLYALTETACGFSGILKEYVIAFRSANPIAGYNSLRKVNRLLKELEPDVVHVHQANRMAYFVSRACHKEGIPCVVTAWGSDVLVIPDKNLFYRHLVQQTLRKASYVTADSKDMITKMQQLAPAGPNKYVHLQYGIDAIVANEKENVIYSNRLHKPSYRIDQVIRYFEEFSEEHPDWRLVIAGSGSQTKELEAQVTNARLSNRVQFVGWLSSDENRQWYARSRIYISIPESDGTSVSLLEAMSAGCAPIAPDLAVSREWIEHGRNGVIESGVENPITLALGLDRSVLASHNSQLIRDYALRENSTERFCGIYTKAITNK